jgi:TM2 domain-containing membrane protein YozV/Tfp pilus assembly protein PilE
MTDMVFCRGCGKQIHSTAPTCPHCGAPQRTGKNLKSKTAAAVLAIFLGGFGIHRFYLGKWWGIFYLLFFWTAIPGLIAFVEGIVFAFTDIEKWDEKYNNGEPSGGSGAGTLVVIIACVFGVIAVIGILAAIAIPAYQDYVTRVKVTEAVSVATQASQSVGGYIESNGQIPDTVQTAGFNGALPAIIQNIDINKSSGEMVVTMGGTGYIKGKSFALQPAIDSAKKISWKCVPGTLPVKLLPQQCKS